MNIVNVLVLLTLSGGGDFSPTYEEIYAQAYYDCFSGMSSKIITERNRVLRNLIAVERLFFRTHPEIPQNLRGMLIAAACRESRFNPHAKGDWNIDGFGTRTPRAIGVVQLWPWWHQHYKINRYNHVEAAHAWLSHIVYQYDKNNRLKRCPSYFSETKKWIAAWVQTARGGKVNKANRFRCFQTPSHYKLLKKWKKEIKNIRELEERDGC